jgi:hypothetical protein
MWYYGPSNRGTYVKNMKETIVAPKGLPKKAMTNDCRKEFTDHMN